MVENTFEQFGKDKPMEIKLGNFQITKCLDLAIAQMKPGQRYKVDCPAKFCYGPRSPYGLSNEQIPKNSDLTYKIDLISCNKRSKKSTEHQVKKQQRKEAKAAKKIADDQNGIPPAGKLNVQDEKKYIKFVEKVIEEEKEIVKKEEKHIPITQNEITHELKVVQKKIKKIKKVTEDTQDPKVEKKEEQPPEA